MKRCLCGLLVSCLLCTPAYASESDFGYGEIQIGSDADVQDNETDNLDIGENSIVISDDVLDDTGTGSFDLDTSLDSLSDTSDEDIIIEPLDQLDTSVRESRNLVVYRDSNISAVQSALDKIWKIITKYADQNYYLKNGWSDLMTADDKRKLSNIAKSVTGNCKTDYDKIRAVYTYITDNVYYDWDYADSPDDYPDRTHTAMEVMETNKAVCEGFASFSKVLLQLSGIPCVSIRGANHIYNAGYDSDQDAWVIFDTTLGTKNYHEDGDWHTDVSDMSFFDLSIEDSAKLKGHEILFINGLLPKENAGHYVLRTDVDNWTDTSAWYCALEDANNKKAISVVDSIGGLPVLKVEDFAFDGDTNLVSVDMSKAKITEIGPGAFRDCPHLSEVQLSDSLVSIGEYAFFKNSDLFAIDLINTKVKTVGERAFSNCGNLVRVSFSDDLYTLGTGAFYACRNLRTVGVENTKLTEISKDCFRGCTILRAFTGSKSLARIRENAFASCLGLRYIRLLNNKISIDKGAIGGYVNYWFD